MIRILNCSEPKLYFESCSLKNEFWFIIVSFMILALKGRMGGYNFVTVQIKP